MEKSATLLLILLLIINVITLILISKSNNKKDYNELLKKQKEFEERNSKAVATLGHSISEEFSRNRMESSQSQSSQRRELTSALSDMSAKIEKSAKDTYNFNMQTVNTISQSLNDIKKSNVESLDKIRHTVGEKLSETLSKPPSVQILQNRKNNEYASFRPAFRQPWPKYALRNNHCRQTLFLLEYGALEQKHSDELASCRQNHHHF